MLSTLPILIIALISISFAVGNYCINTLFANKIKVQKQYNLHLWFGTNQSKTETEVLFLSFASCWILYFAIIVSTGMYHEFKRWEYLYVCTPMALIYILIPFFYGMESDKPFFERYYIKANVWIWILSYVGNFYWTHHFYNLLGAKYTFDAHRINDVPIAMFMATHAYFCFYHSLTNVCIRRMRRTMYYSSCNSKGKIGLNMLFIGFLAYTTAFMETKTIEGFDYWEFQNRDRALLVGSVVYMIYFIVSFPKFLQVDEGVKSSNRKVKSIKGAWTIEHVVWDSLGSCMLVTILLDFWRLWIGRVA